MLGVDLGARRIGLARSDPSGTLASPVCVLARSGDPGVDHRAILAAAREAGADRIVVGLPISLSGDEGPAARGVRDELVALRQAAGELIIEVHDERFSTVTGDRALSAAGHRSPARRQVIDAAAAAVMLQSWLEAHA